MECGTYSSSSKCKLKSGRLCGSFFSGNGYIKTSCLKEILRELDDQLSDRELDGIIQEIDTDGSGTVDFDGKRLKY